MWVAYLANAERKTAGDVDSDVSAAVNADRPDTLGDARAGTGLVDGETVTNVNGALVDETHEFVS